MRACDVCDAATRSLAADMLLGANGDADAAIATLCNMGLAEAEAHAGTGSNGADGGGFEFMNEYGRWVPARRR